MPSYHVIGFCPDHHKVSMIVDARPGEGTHQTAERIAGQGYCFCTSWEIRQPVPDHVKNRLFATPVQMDELHAAVPELRPRAQRRGAVR